MKKNVFPLSFRSNANIPKRADVSRDLVTFFAV